MSFAGPEDPEMQLKIAALRKKGIVLVAAAGNAGPTSKPLYPAAYPDVIAVTDDPLRDVNALKNVTFVMKDGQVYKSPAPAR